MYTGKRSRFLVSLGRERFNTGESEVVGDLSYKSNLHTKLVPKSNHGVASKEQSNSTGDVENGGAAGPVGRTSAHNFGTKSPLNQAEPPTAVMNNTGAAQGTLSADALGSVEKAPGVISKVSSWLKDIGQRCIGVKEKENHRRKLNFSPAEKRNFTKCIPGSVTPEGTAPQPRILQAPKRSISAANQHTPDEAPSQSQKKLRSDGESEANIVRTKCGARKKLYVHEMLAAGESSPSIHQCTSEEDEDIYGCIPSTSESGEKSCTPLKESGHVFTVLEKVNSVQNDNVEIAKEACVSQFHNGKPSNSLNESTNVSDGMTVLAGSLSAAFEEPLVFSGDLPVMIGDLNEGEVIYEEPSVNSFTTDNQSNTEEHGPVDSTLSEPSEVSTAQKRTRTRRSQQSSPVRRRCSNPTLWKANVRKEALNSGKEYISAKGKLVEAKKMRNPCACKLDCVHRLVQEKRQEVFNKFWELGNHERQWDFIRRNTQSAATKNRKHIQEEQVKRKVSRTYFFLFGKEKIKVCKTMFMTTLGIWDSWIDSAYKHLNPEKGCTVSPDKRGRHKHHHKPVSEGKIISVVEHVNLFPRVPSHYCRKRSQREYLENGLSLSKMSNLYVDWASKKGLPRSALATKRQYRDIVNSKFNLGFFRPKKDQCNLCCVMRNKNNTRQVREKYKVAWVSHQKNKEKARQLKAKDKAEAMKDESIAVCCFDLQKQLNCPKSESSCFYYGRKIIVLNFTVFNMIKRVGTCYLWHRGIARKGSDEISSCLVNYIENLVSFGYKDIWFYSDNCAGQNKNRYLFAMYVFAATKYSIKITHRYLEPGHTQMEADSIHARIETASKGKEIFDFDDWVKEIEEAKVELPKYKVVKLLRSKIFSFKPLVQMQNWDKDLKGTNIAWSKVREVCVNGQEQGNLFRVKYDLDGPYITMTTNSIGRPVNLKTYDPVLAYQGNIPLQAALIKDLKWMCQTDSIPVNKQQFFLDLIAGVDSVEEEVVTDPEYESGEELCNAEEETQNEGSVDGGEESDSEEADDPEEF